jgi:microcystin-dependent protein
VSTPYLGEIRMFGGNFAPAGWRFCDGSLLPIQQNDALFSLIGTTYGGDGQTTFAVPDLRGRIPIHQGGSYSIGSSGGASEVTLGATQMPGHTHGLLASNDSANATAPAGNVVAASLNTVTYYSSPPLVAMAPSATTGVGGSQPHNNLQPYLCVNFIIALEGIYPTQN